MIKHEARIKSQGTKTFLLRKALMAALNVGKSPVSLTFSLCAFLFRLSSIFQNRRITAAKTGIYDSELSVTANAIAKKIKVTLTRCFLIVSISIF